MTKNKTEISNEMRIHFQQRTNRHIALVQKYGKILAEKIGFDELVNMVEDHDESKYGRDELDPYVWLTWRYKCADDGVECILPEGMEEEIKKATLLHIMNNPHHPEYHQNSDEELLNDNDRDGIPENMVDATAMPDWDIAEMVCDWCSMSEERDNTPREWADKTVNKRWGFTERQTRLIYSFIDQAWEE